MSAGSRAPLKLAILISGRGSNMVAITHACVEGFINARVEVVISDRASAGGLNIARELGIESLCVPWHGAGGREEFERIVRETVDAREVDVIVLAGFMRILSPEFTAR